MAELDDLIAEEAVRAAVGSRARVTRYQAHNDAPMVRVIAEAERQLQRPFAVFWVEEGPAEMFCLPQFTPSPVAFSTRYLSLTAFVRHLLVDPFSGEIVADTSERTALKLMAEMSLRHGDPDLAVLALVQSLLGKGVWTSDDDQIMALEYEPRNEAYMATWFYGLVHELGHLHADQARTFPKGPLSDAGIAAAVEQAFKQLAWVSEPIRNQALEHLRGTASSAINIANVRAEGLADTFAVGVLLKTTIDVMREFSPEPFQMTRFAQEMMIFMNVLAFIDRCRKVAAIASTEGEDREVALEFLVRHPASVIARILLQRIPIDDAAARHVFGESPTPEDFEATNAAMNGLAEGLRERISHVDAGLGRAMEFALFPSRRMNDWPLLETFRQELGTSPLARSEAERFCDLADSLSHGGKLLTALKGVLADPSAAIVPDPRGDLTYIVPWVEGPDGTDVPFGLDTRHGHLVFAFVSQEELYDAYFKPSERSLPEGYSLTSAAVLVPRKQQLGSVLARHMPPGKPFRVVVEGTPDFNEFMRELGDDTIWNQ